MTPAADDLSRWEVVPNFLDRTGIPLYQAPSSGSPDARVVEGNRSWKPAHVAVLLALPYSSFAFSVLGHTVVAGAVAIAIALAGVVAAVMIAARRRALKVPRVVTTTEGLAVTDIRGQVRSAPWSDVGSLSLLRQKSARGEVVQLAWSTMAGEHITLDLGDTIDLVDVRHAITHRAPSTLELRSEAKLAYDEEDSGE